MLLWRLVEKIVVFLLVLPRRKLMYDGVCYFSFIFYFSFSTSYDHVDDKDNGGCDCDGSMSVSDKGGSNDKEDKGDEQW